VFCVVRTSSDVVWTDGAPCSISVWPWLNAPAYPRVRCIDTRLDHLHLPFTSPHACPTYMLLRNVQFWLCGRCRCRQIECSVRMRTTVLRTVCPLLSTHRHDNLCTSFCSLHHTRTTQRCSKWIEARASSQRGRAIQRLEKLESWPHRPAQLWPRGLGTWPRRPRGDSTATGSSTEENASR
jgi:hypothetical protein